MAIQVEVISRVEAAPRPESPIAEQMRATTRSKRSWRCDAWWVGALVAITLLVGVPAALTREPPFEDAAMLMRYSVHLAAGHGVVWNVGEAPVDGATDLGFMGLLAGVVRLGVGVERGARLLDLTALTATVVACYLFARRRSGARAAISVAAAMFIAVGPAVAYTRAGFGTPVFGLAVAGVWMLADELRRRPEHSRLAVWLGVTTIVCGLIRPEGFLIGACCFVGVLVARGRAVWRALGIACATSVLGGLVFLAWRWTYFGDPLPNPYYKKGGSTLHVDSLVHAVSAVGRLSWPLLIVAVAALSVRAVRRQAAATLLTIALMTSMWVLISDEMNYRMRFQYPVLIVLACSVPALAGPLWDALRARPAPKLVHDSVLLSAVVAVLVVCLAGRGAEAFTSRNDPSRQLAFAQELAATPDRGRVLVTTEAGLVPLLSEWRAIDAWGLNDREIAHSGSITRRRLREVAPAIIFAHAPTRPGAKSIDQSASSFLPGWSRMTDVLIRFAAANGYHLSAAFVAPGEVGSWIVYVRPGMVDSERIARRFARLKVPRLRNVATSALEVPLTASAR